MFGPEYFNQVGWILEGELLSMNELDGIEALTEQWDMMVEDQRAAHAAKGYPAYGFDGRRDVVGPDGESLTFDQYIEDATGARPLMESEVDEMENENAYEASRSLISALEEAVIDALGFVPGTVIEAIKNMVDNFDAEDLGVQVLDENGDPFIR